MYLKSFYGIMDKKLKAQVLAYYLPQFHPIKENDVWWGKGFTEWTNVAKAKKLYRSHYQPKIPADLGFYDLRLPEIREYQALLAQEAGISAFCYWHYWFGNGKQLLERPLQEVIRLKKPDFPFCLAWANHSWKRKEWNSSSSRISEELLIEQKYFGLQDHVLHFKTMLPAFEDPRYFRIKDRLVFVIYNVKSIPDFSQFLNCWNELAEKYNLKGFYFIAHSMNIKDLNDPDYLKCDAINLSLSHAPFDKDFSLINRIIRRFKSELSNLIGLPLNRIDYKDALKYLVDDCFRKKNVIPTIIPNWDHTPRLGAGGTIYDNSTPELFKKHVEEVLDLISNKDESEKIIFLKSWNEWAEGNYMEPDLKYGHGYIDALFKSLIIE